MKLWKIMLAVLACVLMLSAVAMAEEHTHHFVKIEGSEVVASGYTATTVNGQLAHSYTVTFQMKCDGCTVGYTDSRIDTVYCAPYLKQGEVVASTCTEKGYTKWSCQYCGAFEKRDEQAKISHEYRLVKFYEATCLRGGYQVKACATCGKTVEQDLSESYPEVSCVFDVEKKLSDGDCKNAPTYGKFCKWCGGNHKNNPYTKSDKPVGDHKWVKNEVKATCTSYGMMIRDCPVCYTHEEYQIPKLDHKADFTKPTVVKAPTCTEKGLTTYPCYMCNQDGIVKEEVAALGHNTVKHAAKPATCGSDGNDVYYTCTRCSGIFANASGKTVLAAIPVIPANKNGHIKPVGTKPVYTDCTATNNYYSYECTVCDQQVVEYIPASSHDFDTVEECIQKGNTGSAWCTTGDTVTVTCSKCEVESEVKIPALGHKWGNWNYGNAATCTTELVAKRWCARCNEGYEEKIIEEALGHNWILETGTDATCTEEGKGTRICARCKSKQNNVVIPAKGHSFTKTIETVKPTCDAQGYTVFGCANCDATQKGNYTAALGHNYQWEVVVKPSEAGNGKNEYTCQVCNKVADTKTVKYTKYYYNNTMTSFGPMTKELVGGNDWYRVTPVDVTVDGVYTYDLIASNKYVVGTVTISVNAGTLTVSYKVKGNVDVKDESLLIYASKADLAAGSAVTAPVGAAINVAETFGADGKVLVSLILTGDYDAAGKDLVNDAAAAGMIANID